MEEAKQTQSKDSGGRDFLAGVLLGSVAGAVAALLLAPKSGRELRQELNDQVSLALEKTDHMKDTVVKKGSEFRDYANETRVKITKTVQDQTKELVEKVQSFTREAEENAEGALEDAQKAISELSNQIDKKLEELKNE